MILLQRMFDDESSFVDDDSFTSEASFSGDSKSSKAGSNDVVVLSDDDDQWKPKARGTRRTRGQANNSPEPEPQNEVVNTWKTRSRGGVGGGK